MGVDRLVGRRAVFLAAVWSSSNFGGTRSILPATDNA
jgi:hypothetical protein